MTTYSTGWTAEASKVWGGETLSGRMYVSPIGTYDISITNFWNVENEWVSYTSPNGGYSATTDYGYPIPQIKEAYHLWDTNYAGAYIKQNRIDYGYFQLADDWCFSCYVHSASTYNNSGATLWVETIQDGVGGAEDYIKARFSGNTDDPQTFTIWDTLGDNYYSAGTEYIGSGWSRIYIAGQQPTSGRTTRVYQGGIRTDSLIPFIYDKKELMFAGQMFDGGTLVPRSYRYRKNVSVHPSTPIQISDYDTTINTNAISRSRERYFGVVQAQSFPINVVNTDIENMNKFLPDAKYAIQFGFPSYEEWYTVSQGTIGSIQRNADMSLTLNVQDSIMSLLNNSLKRDYTFGLEPWESEVKSRTLDDSSDDYEDEAATGFSHVTAYSANTIDQEFTVEFQNTTDFKIYNENGVAMREFTSESETFDINNDASFYVAEMRGSNAVEDNIYTLYEAGWGTTYVAGDVFVMTASAPRTQDQLTPIGMVKHLIKDVADLHIFDLTNEVYYESPFYNETPIDEYIDENSGATNGISGYFKKGTKYISLIQDCLKLEHASIFPTDDGRIGFSSILDLGTGSTLLNGNPDDTVSIFNGSYVTESMDDFANYVTVEYLGVDSGETKTVSQASDDKTREDRDAIIKVKWRVADSLAYSCASRALLRFNQPKKTYTISTSLTYATTELNAPVTIQDDFLGANFEKAIVTKKEFDLGGQKINLVAWNDPLTLIDIARVDYTEVVTGSTGDTIW